MPDTPTYYMSLTPEGTDVFHCLYCEQAGTEHHSTDGQLFAQHMAQRHDGRLVPTPGARNPADPPAERPPPKTDPEAGPMPPLPPPPQPSSTGTEEPEEPAPPAPPRE